MLLVPRTNMPYEVAASAWNGDPRAERHRPAARLRRVQRRSLDALRAFRDEHRSNGPSRFRSPPRSLQAAFAASCRPATGSDTVFG